MTDPYPFPEFDEADLAACLDHGDARVQRALSVMNAERKDRIGAQEE